MSAQEQDQKMIVIRGYGENADAAEFDERYRARFYKTDGYWIDVSMNADNELSIRLNEGRLVVVPEGGVNTICIRTEDLFS